MLIAQFTDMHVKTRGTLTFGKIDTAKMLSDCVRHVNTLSPRPDAVIVTGDLTNDGQPEEYELLRELLAALAMPYYLIPGNHDMVEPLRAVFQGHTCLPIAGRFLQYTVELPPLRLIALDTTVPGAPGGLLCPERLAWLQDRLHEAPQTPTVIAMHHPPFATGLLQMDAIALANGDDMAAIVRQHPQVERVLCGHLHRPIHVRWAGTIASTAPSTAHQVALSLESDNPLLWRAEPPAVTLHLWRPDTGLISHMSYVDDFGPEQQFSDSHSVGAGYTG